MAQLESAFSLLSDISKDIKARSDMYDETLEIVQASFEATIAEYKSEIQSLRTQLESHGNAPEPTPQSSDRIAEMQAKLKGNGVSVPMSAPTEYVEPEEHIQTGNGSLDVQGPIVTSQVKLFGWVDKVTADKWSLYKANGWAKVTTTLDSGEKLSKGGFGQAAKIMFDLRKAFDLGVEYESEKLRDDYERLLKALNNPSKGLSYTSPDHLRRMVHEKMGITL
jgi:hypothetical protein